MSHADATTHQKISVSLSPDLVNYTEAYRQKHGLPSRSEVIAKALQALRERELAEGYRALARAHEEKPEPLVEMGVWEGLEPSTEETW